MSEQMTLTVAQAAAKLGVHEDTLYAMVRKKEIPHVRVRRRILFRPGTLDEWMRQQELKSVHVEDVV